MNERVLRQYIQEAIITELRRDEKFISMLKNTMNGGQSSEQRNATSQKIAEAWISDFEKEVGKSMRMGNRAQVMRYVGRLWPGLVTRFHGDEKAAKQTMQNLLDTKFNQLRMGV